MFPNINIKEWGPLTVLIIALTVIITIVGGVVVIVHPETLSFDQLINVLSKFVIGAGALSVGNGIQHHGDSIVAASSFPESAGVKADGFSEPDPSAYAEPDMPKQPSMGAPGQVTGTGPNLPGAGPSGSVGRLA